MAENHNLINQDSGVKDWYTDPAIIEAARAVMGGIKLDPASSERANLGVKAEHYFTAPDYHEYLLIGERLMLIEQARQRGLKGSGDGLIWREYLDGGGLDREWFGTVWLNHPFGRDEAACSWDCTKKICQRRGWHTVMPLPGNEAWIAKLVAEFHHGGVIQACCISYASFGSKWMHPLRDFVHWKPLGRVHYITPDGERARSVTKESVVHYLGSKVKTFARVFEDRLGGDVYGKIRPRVDQSLRGQLIDHGYHSEGAK